MVPFYCWAVSHRMDMPLVFIHHPLMDVRLVCSFGFLQMKLQWRWAPSLCAELVFISRSGTVQSYAKGVVDLRYKCQTFFLKIIMPKMFRCNDEWKHFKIQVYRQTRLSCSKQIRWGVAWGRGWKGGTDGRGTGENFLHRHNVLHPAWGGGLHGPTHLYTELFLCTFLLKILSQ